MKTYKQLKEDIGLSTGSGIATFDPVMGKPTQRFLRIKDVYRFMGICEDCHKPLVLRDGRMVCLSCTEREN